MSLLLFMSSCNPGLGLGGGGGGGARRGSCVVLMLTLAVNVVPTGRELVGLL